MSSALLPALVIFGLDYTLWPHVAHFISFPCERKNGTLVDKYNCDIIYYPQVPPIFELLKNNSVKIAIIQRIQPFDNSTYPLRVNGTLKLISDFGWDKYVSFREVGPEPEEELVKNIQEKSKIPYDKMMIFSSDVLDPKPLRNMGVFVKYSYEGRGMIKGLTTKYFNESLKEYESHKQGNSTTEKMVQGSNTTEKVS